MTRGSIFCFDQPHTLKGSLDNGTRGLGVVAPSLSRKGSIVTLKELLFLARDWDAKVL